MGFSENGVVRLAKGDFTLVALRILLQSIIKER